MPNNQMQQRRGRESMEDEDRGRNSRSRNSNRDNLHEHRTAKVVELVCSSTKSFEDAIRKGIQDAAETTRGITGCHVENMSVKCENGEIVDYRVNLKVAFGIERTPAP